jgi:hypothetical protein
MLLVRTVSGPSEAVAGREAVYNVTSFNMSNPSMDEVRKVNWRVERRGKEVATFKEIGDTLRFEVPEALVGETISVMAFLDTATSVVSVVSRVVAEESLSSTSSKLIVLSRADWGARTDLPRRGIIVDPIRRTEVFVHHTVIVDDDQTRNEFESEEEVIRKMRRLQTVRQQDLGPDVPYSFVAFCMANGDLLLCEGRGLHRSGAHTSGHNRSALGISFQGNYEDIPLPQHFDSQLTALGGFLRGLRQQEGFVNLGANRPLGREVFGHREVKATACPGRHLFGKLRLIRFL